MKRVDENPVIGPFFALKTTFVYYGMMVARKKKTPWDNLKRKPELDTKWSQSIIKHLYYRVELIEPCRHELEDESIKSISGVILSLLYDSYSRQIILSTSLRFLCGTVYSNLMVSMWNHLRAAISNLQVTKLQSDELKQVWRAEEHHMWQTTSSILL